MTDTTATLHVLVTGFEPFGGDSENASERAVSRLATAWDGPHRLSTTILPVTFTGAPARLREAVAELQPDLVISVGEAGRRGVITPERFGRNIMDARIPDNAGDQPRDARIDAGPAIRTSSIDVDGLTAAVRAAGLPAETSEDAGGFVCNRITHEVATLDIPGAFVHVPGLRTEGEAGTGSETDAADGAETYAVDDTDREATADGAATGNDTNTAASDDATSSRRLSFDDLAIALRACVDDAIAQILTR